MISVCIPVYNRDVRDLVAQLQDQISELEMPSEIILIDDASSEKIRHINRDIPSSHATLIELTKNIGRARIRNRFLEHTLGNYLIFLDCDMSVPSGDYIQNYVRASEKHSASILCGGSIYSLARPERVRRLHWKYGTRVESHPPEHRNMDPHSSFMSANFMISRDLFEQCMFDSQITAYGHEDSLFGFRLAVMGYAVIHIDNPLVHEGLRNLNLIRQLDGTGEEFSRMIRLLRYVSRMDRYRITPLIRVLYFLLGSPTRFLLRAGVASIPLYSFYKLGMYIKIRRYMNKK